ncbi:hypothetical protein ACFLXU_01260 [Chloroflexota bacterium]
MPGSRFCFLTLSALVLLLVGCAGGDGEVKAPLGQEFSLAVAQTAVIRGENLKIKFEEVLEDSRCPRGVTCVWEGRVRCLVQLTDNDSSEKIELTEHGLSAQSSEVTYKDYQFAFHVIPYPEAGKEITTGEYRLLLSVSKLK